MNILWAIIILALLGAGGFVIVSRSGGERGSDLTVETKVARSDIKTKAPLFTLKDYAGNEVALANFKGKNVIVNAWAAWCPFCVQELKDFAILQKELGDRVTIIAVDRAESLETAKQYTDDVGVTEGLTFLLDPGDSFYRSIGGFSMPETIFVNSAGEIVFHKRGPMPLEEMRSIAQRVFAL